MIPHQRLLPLSLPKPVESSKRLPEPPLFCSTLRHLPPPLLHGVEAQSASCVVQPPIGAPFCLEKAHPLNTLVQVLDAAVGTAMVSQVSQPAANWRLSTPLHNEATTSKMRRLPGTPAWRGGGGVGAGDWTQPRSSYILRPPYYTASQHEEELTAAHAPVSQVGWSKKDANGSAR